MDKKKKKKKDVQTCLVTRSQSQKTTYMIPFKTGKSIGTNRLVVARGWRDGVLGGTKFLFGVMEIFWN